MKQKIIFLHILFILLFGTAFSSHAYNVSETVRIGVKYASTAVSSITVSSADGFLVRAQGKADAVIWETDLKSVYVDSFNNSGINSYFVIEQSGFENYESAISYCENNGYATVPYYRNGVLYVVREGLYNTNDANYALQQAKAVNSTAYIVEPAATRVKLSEKQDGRCLLIFSQDDSEILGLESRNGGTVSIGSSQDYEGIMEFKRVNNSLYLINNLNMQNYLYSVVTAEIGATAPLEAQKAQAICARTYTEENLNRHKSDGFNLCSSTHCQVYSGTKNVRDQAKKAVDETANLIMTYNGKPISAVYYAHSGGQTANVEDVWGNPYPYLKSVEDEYCGDYTWKYKIDFNDVTKLMEEKGYSIGTVTSIKILETSDYGIVKKLQIAGTKGSKVFERESARTILGLKSQQFSIPYEDLSHSVKSSNGTSVKTVSSVLTASGKTTVTGSIKIKDASGKITIVTAKESGVVEGKGYGHQVGMSQHGAMGYANAGWDYEQILKHYYQGIEIEGE